MLQQHHESLHTHKRNVCCSITFTFTRVRFAHCKLQCALQRVAAAPRVTSQKTRTELLFSRTALKFRHVAFAHCKLQCTLQCVAAAPRVTSHTHEKSMYRIFAHVCAMSCRSLSAKKTSIIGLFCRKRPIQIKKMCVRTTRTKL